MAWNDPKFFDLTEDHMKLLERFYVTWNDNLYEGAPEINPKRPYGNSMPMNDVCEILGWETEEEYLTEDDELMEKATKIHREMAIVLQILVDNSRIGISPGKYIGEWNGQNWKRLNEKI